MSRRLKISYMILPMLGVTVGLFVCAGPMFPFREGNSQDFWLAACSVKLDPQAEAQGGEFFEPRDGWIVYSLYYPGTIAIHGETRYRVGVDEIMRDFDRVVDRVSNASQGALPDYVTQAYKAWAPLDGEVRPPLLLLDEIRKSRREQLVGVLSKSWETTEDSARSEISGYLRRQDQFFVQQWRRSRHYSLNLTFEFLFLNGLILFAFWPWLRNLRPWRWGVHFALLPIVLLAPYFLGYAPWTFTSVGPSGGVLYPWIISPLRGDPFESTALDIRIAESLPRILEPLNQLGSEPLAVTGMGAPSPLFLIVTGAVLGFLVFVSRWIWSRRGESLLWESNDQ